MNLLIFISLLASLQVSGPIPRKVSDDGASGRANIKNQANAKEQESPQMPPSVEVNDAPKKDDTSRADQSTKNTNQAVSVREFPPVSVRKDWADWGFWGFSVLLVLIGGFQVWLLFGTMKATKLNAEALVASQRAQLFAEIDTTPIWGLNIVIFPQIKLKVTNRGQTPAYECIHEVWAELLPIPFVDFTDAAEHAKTDIAVTIHQNIATPVFITVAKERPLRSVELSAVKNGTSVLCFRVLLTYKDAFDKKRFANFGFMMQGTNTHYLPKYNDSN